MRMVKIIQLNLTEAQVVMIGTAVVAIQTMLHKAPIANAILSDHVNCANAHKNEYHQLLEQLTELSKDGV